MRCRPAPSAWPAPSSWVAAPAWPGFAIWTHVLSGQGVLPRPSRSWPSCSSWRAAWSVRDGHTGWGFAATTAAIAATMGSLFVSLYPNVMVSSTNAAYNLTVANAASGHYALTVMTVVAVIFTPLVIAYQAWSYYVFRARIKGPGGGSIGSSGRGAEPADLTAPQYPRPVTPRPHPAGSPGRRSAPLDQERLAVNAGHDAGRRPPRFTRPSAGMAGRERLHRQLTRGLDDPVTTVTGPPGSGKTVLLSGWARQARPAGRLALRRTGRQRPASTVSAGTAPADKVLAGNDPSATNRPCSGSA